MSGPESPEAIWSPDLLGPTLRPTPNRVRRRRRSNPLYPTRETPARRTLSEEVRLTSVYLFPSVTLRFLSPPCSSTTDRVLGEPIVALPTQGPHLSRSRRLLEVGVIHVIPGVSLIVHSAHPTPPFGLIHLFVLTTRLGSSSLSFPPSRVNSCTPNPLELSWSH